MGFEVYRDRKEENGYSSQAIDRALVGPPCSAMI
jgi:hypothetical protein